MFALKEIELFFIALVVSALLFFVLAYYKRYAYFWWAIGGIIACFPIALLVNTLQKHPLKSYKFSNTPVFIVTYFMIYVTLWLVTKREAVPERERALREKLDIIIFDGFLALKENRIEDAYHIFRNASVSYPDNELVKTMLASFERGSRGMMRKSRLLDFHYRLKLFFKGKKYLSQKSQSRQKALSQSEDSVKRVQGEITD
ncbi:MAG: hypothetical protein OEZ36_10525 [Spirochaetota bacterium]|nr:hypothetical protein [Spirochaetota bacterium]